DGDVLGLVGIRNLPFQTAEFQKVLPQLVVVPQKFVRWIPLGTPSFQIIVHDHNLDILQIYGYFPNILCDLFPIRSPWNGGGLKVLKTIPQIWPPPWARAPSFH